MSNQITTTENDKVPDPINVQGYLVSAFHVNLPGEKKLQVRIHPEPPVEVSDLVYTLAYSFFNACGELNKILYKLKVSENVISELRKLYSELQLQKNQLISELDDLKNRLAKLLEENADVKMRLKRLEDKEIYSGLGAWIEEARRQIMTVCGENVTRSSDRWRDFVRDKNNHSKIRDNALSLYGLTDKEWKRLSIDFYEKRNSSIHYFPSIDEVTKLLELLHVEHSVASSADHSVASTAHQLKPLFEKLIAGVNRLREAEELPEY
jgi:regulator of replication initiation timing